MNRSGFFKTAWNRPLKSVSILLICISTIILITGKSKDHADSHEYALFPNGVLNVSQVAYKKDKSHEKVNATDILPKGDLVAPFSGTVRYTDKDWGLVWLESDDEVYWADGTLGKMCVGFMHDEDISDLPKGKKLVQGEPFYQKGVKSLRNNVSGPHVHIIIYRGAFNNTLKSKYSDRANAYIYDALFLTSDTKIVVSGYSKDKWRILDIPANTQINSTYDSVIRGSDVTLNWEATNAVSYRLQIMKNGLEYLNEDQGDKTSWSGKFTGLGNYECKVIPYGKSSKEGKTATVSFTVVPMYVAPTIENLKVTYSGYKYIEVEGTITDPGQGNAGYEIGLWEGSKNSPSFHAIGETTVEGNILKSKMTVVDSFVDANVSKYLGKELTIGVKGIDTLGNSHYVLCKKMPYEYKYPIPSATKVIDGHTYYRFDQPYTWEDAFNFAKNETSGHLVTIGSQAESDGIISMITGDSSYYIGGKIDETSGKWTWTDGSNFSYTNWESSKSKKNNEEKTVIVIGSKGWKSFRPDFKSMCGFIVEVENKTKLLPTAYPTPSPTPKPTATPIPSPTPKPTATPTPVPKLDTKQARSIVADAMALSYNGMKFYKAYRYDVNGDGVSDMILHSENKERFIIIGYSDSKKVRLYSDTLSNLATEVGFYKSKKSKKLFVRLTRAWAAGSGIWYKSFSNGKLKNETGLEESFYDYDFDADKPVAKLRYTYQIGEKIVSKSKYNKKVKSWKLKRIKATKKTNILKRQTKMSSELIDDAAKYIKSDILGNKVDFIFRDINGDNIKDCYFVIPGKKAKGYKGIVVSNDNGDSNWTDVAVVLQSSKKGVVVKYLSPSDAKKLFKWAI